MHQQRVSLDESCAASTAQIEEEAVCMSTLNLPPVSVWIKQGQAMLDVVDASNSS